MNNIKFNYNHLSANTNPIELTKQMINNQLTTCGTSELENIFFSDENINIINHKLILSVFNLTDKKFKIAKQSKESLIIVMRYVFINYAKHLPYNIKEQNIELINLVLKEIIPNIITNVTQKANYLNYINERPPLLDLPISTSKTKTLSSYI